MFVPFLTKRETKKLYRRKGGGGGGRGGGGGGGKSGSSGSSGGGSGGGGRSSSVSTGSGARTASSGGNGGGRITTIPAGQPFAGRQAGGGTRQEVFGTQQYGSGYPGVTGRGVAGRGFPFYFWPIAWGGAAGAGTGAYLHNNEYGRPDNSSRPGGVLVTAAFISSSNGTNTFRLFADNTTVTSLIEDIRSNCSSSLASNSSASPSTFDPNGVPKPEQAVQYYRASSVALTLDGYNNTGALGPEGTPDTPLPSGIDTTLLNCLNTTIGNNVPLVDAAHVRWSAPNMGLLALFWMIWSLSSYY